MLGGKRHRGAKHKWCLWIVLVVVIVIAISYMPAIMKVSADTEPNDDFLSAEPIVAGTYSGSLGVTPPDDNNDYYSVTLTAYDLWVYVNVTIPIGGPTMKIGLLDSTHNLLSVEDGAGPGIHQIYTVFFSPQTAYIWLNRSSGSGSYQMEIFITDTRLDTTPPVISNLRPPDKSIMTTKTPVISADYLDYETMIDVDNVVLKVDSVDVTSSATVTPDWISYTPASLAEGNHSIYLEVKDTRGNLATQTWNFTVDTLGPTITDFRPANASSTNNNIPLIAANYSDSSGINLASVVLVVDDMVVTSNATITGNGLSYTPTTPLADGSHFVGLAVKDNLGNAAMVGWYFTVSTTPPPTSKSFLEESWWVLVLTVVIIITVIAVAFLLTRRKKTVETPSSEQTSHQ